MPGEHKQGRGEDIGMGEAYTLNLKRLTEEFLQESLESIRRGRKHFDRMSTNALSHDERLKNYSELAVKGAVELQHALSVSMLNNMGISVDRQWNIDEVSGLSAKTPVEIDALMTLLASKIAAELNKEKA